MKLEPLSVLQTAKKLCEIFKVSNFSISQPPVPKVCDAAYETLVTFLVFFFSNHALSNCRCVKFVAAVCILLLLKLKRPRNKSVYKLTGLFTFAIQVEYF